MNEGEQQLRHALALVSRTYPKAEKFHGGPERAEFYEAVVAAADAGGSLRDIATAAVGANGKPLTRQRISQILKLMGSSPARAIWVRY